MLGASAKCRDSEPMRIKQCVHYKPNSIQLLTYLKTNKMSSKTKNTNSAGKKKGGGFLARAAKAKSSDTSPKQTVSEEELLAKEYITPDDVLALNRIAESK